MNKVEFLNRLEQLLNEIPKEEREEAIRYYQDYFDDAVDIDEEKLIEELGTPEKIARQIKVDLYNKASKEAGIYTENGYSNAFFDQKDEPLEVVPTTNDEYSKDDYRKDNYRQNDYRQNEYRQDDYQRNDYRKGKSTSVALIILLIVTCPIWGSIVFGLGVAVVGTLFGIIVGFGAAFVGLFIAGIACVVGGIAQLFSSFVAGMLLIGVGLILLALSICFYIVCMLIVRIIIPGIFNGIRYIIKSLSKGEGR